MADTSLGRPTKHYRPKVLDAAAILFSDATPFHPEQPAGVPLLWRPVAKSKSL
jgi:hypothetical protein